MEGKTFPTVKIQDGPTPGFCFAVFRDNPEYHDLSNDDWERQAKRALERHIGIRGGMLIGDIRKEPLRPFNLMAEFRVTP